MFSKPISQCLSYLQTRESDVPVTTLRGFNYLSRNCIEVNGCQILPITRVQTNFQLREILKRNIAILPPPLHT